MNCRRRSWLWGIVPASLAAALVGCDGSEPTEPPAQPAFSVSTPNAPSNTSAVAVAFDTVKVSWRDNSTNENGFQLYRSTTGSSGTFSLRATRVANATTFRDGSVTQLKSYCYKIRSFRTQDGQTRY